MHPIACVLLVDPAGRLLLQLRDEHAPHPEGTLRHFATQELPEIDRVKHYFCGATRTRQEDVVVGEGAAIVFVTADELFDGRPFTPGTAELLTRFLASPEYARLSAAG